MSAGKAPTREDKATILDTRLVQVPPNSYVIPSKCPHVKSFLGILISKRWVKFALPEIFLEKIRPLSVQIALQQLLRLPLSLQVSPAHLQHPASVLQRLTGGCHL